MGSNSRPPRLWPPAIDDGRGAMPKLWVSGTVCRRLRRSRPISSMENTAVSRSSLGLVGSRRPRGAQGWLSLSLALVLVPALLFAPGPAAAKAGPDGFSELAAKLLPSVV